MRVSSLQVFQQATDSLMRSLSELVRLNEQVSSGKRINKPSDDPGGAGRALDYQVVIDVDAQYRKNVGDASNFIGFTDNTLSSVSSALTRAKELAVQGANGAQSADSRAAIAQEVSQLRNQLLSLANSQFENRYVFSGFRTDAPAFDATSLSYQGDSGTINAAVDKNATIPTNVTGPGAFGCAPAAEEVVPLDDGRRIHYIPAGGTTVNVEIRAADDTTVLDSFSFDNMMKMTDLLSQALAGNDTGRISALLKPLDDAAGRVNDVRADLGARLNRLDDQGSRLDNATYSAQTALSGVQDADIASTVSGIAKASTALQALQQSAAKILSQSLLDFLR
jgi:flagellar hook-associated protein 3 FlgL